MSSSTVVVRKPLSANSSFMPTKKESSDPTGLPVRGSRTPLAGGETRVMRSIPFERPLPPLIYEADGEHAKEDHHGPEAEMAELAERDRPGEQECDFQIENDEQNGDEVEAHVELHARVVEGVEPAFVGGQLLRVRLLIGDDEGRDQQRKP